ncbi:MAG: MFS transporter [Cyanothece sp. SIO2G6]|nr:MFS transporter [Cyanothece sp. SIO2G6]
MVSKNLPDVVDDTTLTAQSSWIRQLSVLPKQFRNFLLFWFGQSLSQIGTRLTGFGLGIWVYQNTHAVTQLSLVFFITTLPGVLLTPIVGALVDRWNRRWVIFFSDCGAALVTAALILLLFCNNLQIRYIYLSAFLTSLCGSFQMLAKGAAVPMMVSKQQLGRVNGLLQFSTALSTISAPALAGVLIGTVQLRGLLLIDLASYSIGLLTLLFVSIPQPEKDPTSSSNSRFLGLFTEISEGWEIISSQFVLMLVLGFMAIHFFINGMTNVLINPLILSFSTAQVFGSVMAIGGAGMVVGSVVMSIWGVGNSAFTSLLAASTVNALGLVIMGLKPSVMTITIGLFISFLTLPIVLGANQVIWQTSVKPSFQGRVLALVGTFTGLLAAFGNIGASPLADMLLEPMFADNGLLVSTVGQVIETGTGRGIGFLLILEGCFLLAVSLGVYAYVRWRMLDQQLLAAMDTSEGLVS